VGVNFALLPGVVVLTHVGAVSCVVVLTQVGAVSCERVDTLDVTACHLDDLRSDLNRLAPPLLPAALALVAHGHQYLVIGSTLVARTPEHLTRHEQQRGVLIERVVRLAPKFGDCFAEGGERFGADLHPKDVSSERRMWGVAGQISGRMTRHQLFDLADALAASRFEPGSLTRGRSHAGEFPGGGPKDCALAKGKLQLGQAFERFSYAKPFLSPAWAIAEHSFDVFAEAGEAEMNVNLCAQCLQ
jgi:hypothetical protein